MGGGSDPGTGSGLTQAALAVSFGPTLECDRQGEILLCIGLRSKLLKQHMSFSRPAPLAIVGGDSGVQGG
jgi:hypothetical protein